jgi:serine/threonine protein kinase
MGLSRHEELVEAFGRARAMAAAARASFLVELRGRDAELCEEVESLLAADELDVAFLDRTADSPQVIQRASAVADPLIGKQIGSYLVRRVIASGGMGTVYEASQSTPGRTVALKVIRSSFVTKPTLRRFEFEVQVLGRLQHPGIAQIFDASVYRDGSSELPYFAMEYIPRHCRLRSMRRSTIWGFVPGWSFSIRYVPRSITAINRESFIAI